MTISPHHLLSHERPLFIRIPIRTSRHSEGPKGDEEPAAAETNKSDSSTTKPASE